MYNVSSRYKNAMLSSYQRCSIRGVVGGVSFDADNVLSNALSIEWKCANDNAFSFGGVFATKLNITFTTNLLGRGNWLGKKIVLDYGQVFDDDTEELVPLGEFFIDTVSYTDEGVVITAYDAMLAFDVDASSFQSSGFLFDVLSVVCRDCGVALGNTRREIEAMPNGTKVVGFALSSEISTYRDILHHIAMFLCGFATIGRDGKVYIRQYSGAPLMSLTTEHRITGSKYADYSLHYTEVQFTDLNNENTIVSKSASSNNGDIMSFGANPFIQNLVSTARNEVLTEWLNRALAIPYVPFSSVLIGNPAFDIGDCLKFTGGMAGSSMLVCLTSVHWKFGGGYSATGADMATTNVSGIGAGGSATYASTVNDWRIYTYTNSSDIELINGDVPIELSRISVTNNGTTTVEVTNQINVDVSGPADIQFYYTLDGETIEEADLIQHIPEAGEYIITLDRSMLLQTEALHGIKLFAEITGANATIGATRLETIVKGTKLTSVDGWDGVVEVSEQISISRRFTTLVPNFERIANVSFASEKNVSFADSIAISRVFNTITPDTDNYDIYRDTGDFYILTEDGEYLTDEDGNLLITG